MTNKAKKRVRDAAERTNRSVLSIVNSTRRQGQDALLALRCDVCNEPLITPDSGSMVEWFCEREPPFAKVCALFFCHKGSCDRLLVDLARALELSDFWEEMSHVVLDRADARLSVDQGYEWSRPHLARLRRLFQDASIATRNGWQYPKRGGLKHWDAMPALPLGQRIERCFSNTSSEYAELSEKANARGLRGVDELIAAELLRARS